jgi:hypothetical protein
MNDNNYYYGDENVEPVRENLPRILSVEAALVRYPQPRVYYEGTQKRETGEAVELTVRTNRGFPVQAITPVIFVGDVVISEYEPVEENVYKFYAFNHQVLEQGASISVGWSFAPDRRVDTGIRYRLGTRPTV